MEGGAADNGIARSNGGSREQSGSENGSEHYERTSTTRADGFGGGLGEEQIQKRERKKEKGGKRVS